MYSIFLFSLNCAGRPLLANSSPRAIVFFVMSSGAISARHLAIIYLFNMLCCVDFFIVQKGIDQYVEMENVRHNAVLFPVCFILSIKARRSSDDWHIFHCPTVVNSVCKILQLLKFLQSSIFALLCCFNIIPVFFNFIVHRWRPFDAKQQLVCECL